MDMYYAAIEVDDRTPIAADVVDELMPVLEPYHGTLGMSPRGLRGVSLFLPATSIAQATTTALAVVASVVGFKAQAVAAEVMTEKEFDARQGFVHVPELVSVTEAAELLGVSRQAVLDRIGRGTLQAEKVGDTYAIPRSQLAG